MASIQLIQNFAVAGFPTLIVVIGNGTAFTGTPFSVSGGTSPSITSQVVDGANTARIFLSPGTAAGTLTITDSISGSTATIAVRAAAPTVAVIPLPTGAEKTFVDPVNGNDSTGVRGSRSLPFLTPPAALAVALAGDTVQILPGVLSYSGTPTWITGRTGVNIRGSGIGITTLNSTSTANTFALVPGSDSVISDLSIVTSMNKTSVGVSIGLPIGSPKPTNVKVSRCSLMGYNDAVLIRPQNAASPTTLTWKFDDCSLYSFFDTFNYNPSGNAGTVFFNLEANRCSFLIFGDALATHIARGISLAGGNNSANFQARIADCAFNVTSGTGASNSAAIFSPVVGGGSVINFNVDLLNTSITVAASGTGTPNPINIALGTVNDLGGNTFTGGTNSATNGATISSVFGGETTTQEAMVQVNVPFTFQLDPITGNGGGYVVTVTSANNGVIATVTMGSTTASETFTYTWTSVGTDMLTFTNNGNLGNPPGLAVNIIPQVPLAGEVRFGTTFGPDANGATVGGAGGGSISLNNTIIYSLGKTTGNCATFG